MSTFINSVLELQLLNKKKRFQIVYPVVWRHWPNNQSAHSFGENNQSVSFLSYKPRTNQMLTTGSNVWNIC